MLLVVELGVVLFGSRVWVNSLTWRAQFFWTNEFVCFIVLDSVLIYRDGKPLWLLLLIHLSFILIVLWFVVRDLSFTHGPLTVLTLVPTIVECIASLMELLTCTFLAWWRITLVRSLLVIKTGLQPVLSHSMLNDSSLLMIVVPTDIALICLILCISVQSFLDHSHSLLLVT